MTNSFWKLTEERYWKGETDVSYEEENWLNARIEYYRDIEHARKRLNELKNELIEHVLDIADQFNYYADLNIVVPNKNSFTVLWKDHDGCFKRIFYIEELRLMD